MVTGYSVEPDRGFAWLVLVSSLLNYMIATGVASIGCGVYLAAMIGGYGCSRAEAYVAGALSSGILFGSAPVASILVDKSGLRATAVVGAVVTTTGLVLSANVPTLVYHYITFSITALGSGFMCHASAVVPVHYFVKRRALASSVLYGAAGVCMMVFPIIVRLVIDAYSWRPSFYIMAAIVLNACVLSMLIRPTSLLKNYDTELRQRIYDEPVIGVADSKRDVTSPFLNCGEEEEQALSLASKETVIDGRCRTNQNASIKDKRSESTEAVLIFPSLVQNPFFWLFLANCFLFQSALVMPFVIMPDMYAVGGMNDWQTDVLFILMGCANTLGRALSGILWLRLASPLVVFCSANFVWATSMLLFLGYTNFTCLVFANVFLGLGSGSFITCFSMVTADLVGVRLANRALGLGRLSCGIAGLLAPPILGKLYDATTSYTWSVLLAAMMGFASFVDVFLIFCLERRQKRA